MLFTFACPSAGARVCASARRSCVRRRPVVETGTFDVDYVAFDSSSPCPGIEIHNHEVGTVRQTSYFDNQGNLWRIQLHVMSVDSFYNPMNPDVVLSEHFSATGEVDLHTGELERVLKVKLM